ncbi:esterase/lipase family protein [Streptomyces shenzhenensis]|uniref:esterase/lipase family protein n=1 Tax=Streptomyces shenzhenensis TaxID=943815 RepID=UPI0038268FC7
MPGLSPVRGAGVEASRAAVRLVRLPLDLAAGSVEQLAGRLGRAMPGTGADRDAPASADAGIPVLLVHGLADGGSVVLPLQRALGGLGMGPFVSVSYPAFSPDLRAVARALGEQVELACTRSTERTAVVIGYSLGGLIARYYVQRLGGDVHVPLVITLATPHSGTATALLAPPHPLLRQLRPGSELLTELAQPAAGCGTRFVAFYSDQDEAVIPAAKGRIDHPDLMVRNVLVPGVGHLTLPLHRPVVDQVRSLLAAVQKAAADADPARRGCPGQGRSGAAPGFPGDSRAAAEDSGGSR